MSSFKKVDGMIDSIQKQATGLRTLDGSAIEDFLSIAGYEKSAGGGEGGKYDDYDFVITRVDTETPVLEKGNWQDIYNALQNMEHVTGLYLKNTTPGQYFDTISIVLPLTSVSYYSSADAIQARAQYDDSRIVRVTISWLSDDTINISETA